jgi:hypothetical protein
MPNLTTGSAVRYICLVLALLLLPVTATAQKGRSNDRQTDRQTDRGRSDQRRSDDRRSDDRRGDQRQDNRPTHGLSPLGLQPPATPRTPWWEQRQVPSWERPQTPAWERQRTPTFELNQIPGWENGNVARAMLDRQRNQQQIGNRHRSRNQSSVVYVVEPYRYFPNPLPASNQFYVTPPPPTQPVAPEPPPPPPAPMGVLRLDVEPRAELQIFVDGVYFGTPADLGEEIALSPGTRRIELRAPGHRTLVFVAEIAADRLVTYRGVLESAGVTPPATPRPPVAVVPPAPAGNRTIYLIPGCYMGNVSPKEMALPPGCDISKLTTITP